MVGLSTSLNKMFLSMVCICLKSYFFFASFNFIFLFNKLSFMVVQMWQNYSKKYIYYFKKLHFLLYNFFFSGKIIYLLKKICISFEKISFCKKIRKKNSLCTKKTYFCKKKSFCKKNHSGRKCFIP